MPAYFICFLCWVNLLSFLITVMLFIILCHAVSTEILKVVKENSFFFNYFFVCLWVSKAVKMSNLRYCWKGTHFHNGESIFFCKFISMFTDNIVPELALISLCSLATRTHFQLFEQAIFISVRQIFGHFLFFFHFVCIVSVWWLCTM